MLERRVVLKSSLVSFDSFPFKYNTCVQFRLDSSVNSNHSSQARSGKRAAASPSPSAHTGLTGQRGPSCRACRGRGWGRALGGRPGKAPCPPCASASPCLECGQYRPSLHGSGRTPRVRTCQGLGAAPGTLHVTSKCPLLRPLSSKEPRIPPDSRATVRVCSHTFVAVATGLGSQDRQLETVAERTKCWRFRGEKQDPSPGLAPGPAPGPHWGETAVQGSEEAGRSNSFYSRHWMVSYLKYAVYTIDVNYE